MNNGENNYKTADAIRQTLISPNESDSNLESANVVDGLFAIARSIRAVASALTEINESITTYKVGAALDGLASLDGFDPGTKIAEAIGELADALEGRQEHIEINDKP